MNVVLSGCQVIKFSGFQDQPCKTYSGSSRSASELAKLENLIT
jgi:hypothetical protein